MTEKNKINRRSMLAASAGLAATALSGSAIGKSMTVTPANPEGPFYPTHKQVDTDTDLTLIEGHTERAQGEVIKVTGQVLDDKGQPVEGALVDIWQANTFGRYHHEDDTATTPTDPNFQGWGMVKTDAQGRYAFTTIKPGAYMVNDEWRRPPHIHYKVSRRGFREITTQMYFAGEALNEKDNLLNEVAENERDLLVVDFNKSDGVLHGNFSVVLAKIS
jgi:protocatechuate 3,4-dioxygenase beta subunit